MSAQTPSEQVPFSQTNGLTRVKQVIASWEENVIEANTFWSPLHFYVPLQTDIVYRENCLFYYLAEVMWSIRTFCERFNFVTCMANYTPVATSTKCLLRASSSLFLCLPFFFPQKAMK